jgi:SAM-dependent methyltransferase
MHYRLPGGIVVKSENAAKPEKQASSHLKSIISKLAPVSSSFDYGCGKLRYCSDILKTTDTLAVIDSEIQLSRSQTLRGKKSSIRELLSRSNRIEIFNDEDFKKCKTQFNRGFCINVLSVVPLLSRRREILETIRSHLRPDGTCLFATQYRNSDFTRMQSLPNALPWRDGFLLDSLRGYSFYGLIRPDRLETMIVRAGFKPLDCSLNEGSVYLWATPS